MNEQFKEMTEELHIMTKSINDLNNTISGTNLLIDQIHLDSGSPNHTREFTFYTCSGTYSGAIQEIGDDYVRIRLSSDAQGAFEDIFINMKSVCAVKEVFSRE